MNRLLNIEVVLIQKLSYNSGGGDQYPGVYMRPASIQNMFMIDQPRDRYETYATLSPFKVF